MKANFDVMNHTTLVAETMHDAVELGAIGQHLNIPVQREDGSQERPYIRISWAETVKALTGRGKGCGE